MEIVAIRLKECVATALIALALAVILPIVAFMVFAVRPLVVLAAVGAIVLGHFLFACSARFRAWLADQATSVVLYRGLRLDPEIALHSSHSWARLNGVVVVGADDLVLAALGPVDEVELPSTGRRVRRGERLFRLRHGGRSVDVRAPVTGTVVAGNDDLRRHPELINESPFGTGWVVRLRSDDLSEDRRHLLRGRRARSWFRGEVDRIVGLLPVRSGAPAPEDDASAGDPLYTRLDETAWSRLSEDLFAGADTTEAGPPSANGERG